MSLLEIGTPVVAIEVTGIFGLQTRYGVITGHNLIEGKLWYHIGFGKSSWTIIEENVFPENKYDVYLNVIKSKFPGYKRIKETHGLKLKYD